ncbi:MAG: hypothetical protein GY722_03455 [bacterium]|nr:hypothetical protein [bacterium]
MEDSNPARDGHVWLYVPPYTIVDATVSLQPYRNGEQKHLPNYVLAKDVLPYSFGPNDIMEPELISAFVKLNGRRPRVDDVMQMVPTLPQRVKSFEPVEVRRGSNRLSYVTTRITAPQESLEQWRNITFGGKYPAELYDEFVRHLQS